ncbi:Tetratricopeptide repeat protein 32 [Geodia barretti]|uniref:Tetratricopeptide repeat protein 32 n=1 Tax=Geodia barretti TaxID=519541 RepID=A0AA35SMN6_GEOBA|nr:Tetratricopeptide repeat protein 32 [Geodia barretti]
MELHEKAKDLLSSGQLEESCRLFTRFIDECGDSVEHRAAVTDAYNSRGHIKYLSVDFPGAIADYSTAMERDPGFAVAWYNRGQVRYRLGHLCLSLLQAGIRQQRETYCRP